jgi:hypothetical protein
LPRGHELKHELREGYVVRNPAMDDFRVVADLILASGLASFGEPDYLEDELLANTIHGRDGPARRLLEREGYEAVRHFWRMAKELEEEPELTDGFSIRACVPGEDERAVFEALDEALRDDWEHPTTTFEEWERRKKRFGFDPVCGCSVWTATRSPVPRLLRVLPPGHTQSCPRGRYAEPHRCDPALRAGRHVGRTALILYTGRSYAGTNSLRTSPSRCWV